MSQEQNLLLEYRQARERLSKAREEQAAAQLELDRTESILVQSLLDRGATGTAKYEGVGFANLKKPKVYASYHKEKETDVFGYLKEEGEGELVKLSVHPSSFNGFVGRLIEAGKQIPNYIEYYLKQGLVFYDRR